MPPKKKRGGKKKKHQGTVAEDRDHTGAQENDNGKPEEADPIEENEGRGYQDSNYGEDDDHSDQEKKSKPSKTRLSAEEKEDKILPCERCQHMGNTCNKELPVCSDCKTSASNCEWPPGVARNTSVYLKLPAAQRALLLRYDPIAATKKRTRMFTDLLADVDFSDMKETLYARAGLDTLAHLTKLKRHYVPYFLLFCLGINDYMSQGARRGQMTHNWGPEGGVTYEKLFFAGHKRWGTREAATWRNLAPRDRVRYVNMSIGGHGNQFTTHVLPIRVFSYTKGWPGRLSFYMRGQALETIKDTCAGAVLLVNKNKVWVMSAKKWLRGVTVDNEVSRQKQGVVLCKKPQGWTPNGDTDTLVKAASNGSLEAAVYARLSQMFHEGEDEKDLTVTWESVCDKQYEY